MHLHLFYGIVLDGLFTMIFFPITFVMHLDFLSWEIAFKIRLSAAVGGMLACQFVSNKKPSFRKINGNITTASAS